MLRGTAEAGCMRAPTTVGEAHSTADHTQGACVSHPWCITLQRGGVHRSGVQNRHAAAPQRPGAATLQLHGSARAVPKNLTSRLEGSGCPYILGRRWPEQVQPALGLTLP